MKHSKSNIPTPLQTRILLLTGISILSLVLGIALLLILSSTLALPFLLFTILAALGGRRLYRIAVLGQYLMLTGTILKVERTIILHRPKALLLEAEGKALRVVLRGRHWAPAEGEHITLYVGSTEKVELQTKVRGNKGKMKGNKQKIIPKREKM